MNAAGKYLPSSERPISAALPARPAAVMIYDTSGTCTTLCLDFDAAKAGPAALADDLVRVRAELASAGVAFVEDSSISGGHHLYVPLAERLHRDRARPFVERLAHSLKSLDPSPHRSIQSGCIRVPGSRHRRGGHQVLITALDDALSTFAQGALAEDLESLVGAFPEVVASAAPAAEGPTAFTGRAHTRSGDLRLLMSEGVVPARYSSPSEARMAALCSLASSGWGSADVSVEMASGQLQGLAKLYAKYTPQQQQLALAREWKRASDFVQKKPSDSPGRSHGAKSDMNPEFTSQRGGWDEHGFIREVRSTLDVYDFRLRRDLPPRQVPGALLLLRALLVFAHMTSSREISVGCRSLALATGLSHQTVSRLLTILSQHEGTPIRRKYQGVGLEADTYTVVMDTSLQPIAARRGLARGNIHALRPVFRVLGPVSALVYEGIERSGAMNITELSHHTGFNRSTVRAAVYEMHAHAMIRQVEGTYRIDHCTSLTRLARELGGISDFEAQLSLYRAQRRLWRSVVSAYEQALHGGPRRVQAEEFLDVERDTYWVPPPDAARTQVELVLLAA